MQFRRLVADGSGPDSILLPLVFENMHVWAEGADYFGFVRSFASAFEISNDRKTGGRAQRLVPDDHCATVEKLVARVFGSHRYDCSVIKKESVSERLWMDLKATAFAVKHGHRSSAFEKHFFSTLRCQISGDRKVACAPVIEIHSYLASSEAFSSTAPNLADCRNFIQNAGGGVQKFVESGRNMYWAHLRPGDCLYIPPG